MDTVRDNRTSYIGGSDIPTLFGISKFTTYEDLVNSYIDKIIPSYHTEYTLYGTYMEDKIRQYFNKKYGYRFKPKCKILERKKIRANTDGKYKDMILEIKTNNGKHTNNMDYYLQIQLYLYVFKCNKAYLVEYTRPHKFYMGAGTDVHYEQRYFDLSFDEKNVHITEITRNDECIKQILEKIKTFWKEIYDGQC